MRQVNPPDIIEKSIYRRKVNMAAKQFFFLSMVFW